MQDPHDRRGGDSWWKSQGWSRKEELGEGEWEWVSLNTLSLRKIKIWQDYSTSLKFKRGGNGVSVPLEWRRMGVYMVVVEKIWMKSHLMRVDKG